MKKSSDIYKTFEIFNKDNISILKDRLIEIILIEADNIFSRKNKNMFELDFKKNNSVQISVYNDKEMYDLLSNTWKRYKMKQIETNDKDNKSGIYNQLPGS
ncbi:MAG: hypothetical protein A2Y25_08230 [Candidatus Melainabacteria bacterium GWF2_37_15]|nr:MAG: hypothetical protein A2Y25_08230 [Candidatus Melainabacteria bacterium GWF2_37_15]